MESIRQAWGLRVVAGGELISPSDARAESPDADRADEAALLRAGRAGDRAALDELLGLHERSLLAFCCGILGHAEDAEDAVQETFLRALRALASFREASAFRTWLFRIALNVCLTRRSSRPAAKAWSEEECSPTSRSPSPEAIALHQLQIREALSMLLPRQRAILILKEREEWSVREIALAFRWSERQVRYELSKARLALAGWRQREMEQGGEP
jgi:RNA polymerase sigma-70 factor, ECF subfamily